MTSHARSQPCQGARLTALAETAPGSEEKFHFSSARAPGISQRLPWPPGLSAGRPGQGLRTQRKQRRDPSFSALDEEHVM